MEVTRKNFKENLPKIKDAIDGADFISIDAEFTGLRRDTTSKLCELDTPQERYSKCCEAANDFGMIQFGLTTFRYNIEEKQYHHASYCFYVLGQSREIYTCDSSSLNFLANNGFDFNKLFKDGLSYMSMIEETKRRAELSVSVEASSPSPVKVAEEGAKKFLKDTENTVAAFLEDSDEEVLIINSSKLSGFYRKLIFNNIGAKYPNLLIRTSLEDFERNVEIRKFGSKEEKEKFVKDEKIKALDKEVGFTHVVRYMLERNVPVVGHNLILDLMHLITKTIQPLPSNLEDLKQLIRLQLPPIYDTKLLAKDPPFGLQILNTSLENLYKECQRRYSPPTLVVEEGHRSFDCSNDNQCHNAGFDAFMTGVCFLTMVKVLDGPNWSKKSVVKSKKLAPYTSKLNMMKSHDLPYLNLVGHDVQPKRDHIFHVEIPPDWEAVRVKQLFHMVGSIKLAWINSSSLYVIPLEEIDVKKANVHLQSIMASCPPLVRVRMYGGQQQSENKRKSQVDDLNVAVPSSTRSDFKRLKSVGSEQMSLMSLESPMADEPPVTFPDSKNGTPDKANKSSDGLFVVPDDW
ncbi:poly(A)-specific ribonuclease PARN-like [Oratosquilla oratoria]|uniref:poly(A)-specific ribonuclease PARN-like n=1 Tax=Oratosquilla oratoria TaxID=337810 RepID=UPI003F776196